MGTRRDFSGSQFNSQEWVHRDFSPIFQIWILWWLGLDSLAVWTAAFARGLEFSKIFQEAQVLDFWARGLDRSVASAEYETKNEEFAIFKKLKLFPEFCPVLAIYFRWEPCIYLIYLFLFRLDAFLGSVFCKIAKNHKKPQPSHQSKTCPLVPRGIASLFKRKSPCSKKKEDLSPVQSVCLFLLCLFTLLIMTWMKLELQKNQKNISFIWPFLAWIWFFSLTKFRNWHLPRIHGRKWSKVLVLFMAKLKLPQRAVEFFFHPTCFVQPPNAVVSKVFKGFGLGLWLAIPPGLIQCSISAPRTPNWELRIYFRATDECFLKLSNRWNPWNFHKIQISEISFFHKIHISEISIFTKFTFLKCQNQGKFWKKVGFFLPQCG